MRTDRERKTALHELPPDLPRTYKRVLDRLAEVPTDLMIARKAFMWLLFLPHRLTLSELGMAVAIDPGEGFSLDRRLDNNTDLLDICGSLLRYSATTDVVEFGHFSVVQYLTSQTLPGGEPNPYYVDSVDGKAFIGKCVHSAYPQRGLLGEFGKQISLLWDYLAWSTGVQRASRVPIPQGYCFKWGGVDK